MKYLITAIACCLALAGSAQFPYNPDSNNDQLVGAEDLLTFLPLYGQYFSPPSPPVTQVFNQNLGYLQQCTNWSESDTCVIYDFTTDIELDNPFGNAVLLISADRYWGGLDLKVWGEYSTNYALVVHHHDPDDPEWDWYEEVDGGGMSWYKTVHYYLTGPNGGLYRVR